MKILHIPTNIICCWFFMYHDVLALSACKPNIPNVWHEGRLRTKIKPCLWYKHKDKIIFIDSKAIYNLHLYCQKPLLFKKNDIIIDSSEFMLI